MDSKFFYIEIGAIIVMALAVISIIVNRIMTERGIGTRVLQFASITIGIPAVLILALEDKFSAGVSTLFAALFGYLLANVKNFDSLEKKKKRESQNTTSK